MSTPDLSSLPARMRYAATVLEEAARRDFCKTPVWHPDSLRRAADRLDPRSDYAGKPVSAGRQRVIDVFGTDCPVCGHNASRDHDWMYRCTVCGTNCSTSFWPAESVARWRKHQGYDA